MLPAYWDLLPDQKQNRKAFWTGRRDMTTLLDRPMAAAMDLAKVAFPYRKVTAILLQPPAGPWTLPSIPHNTFLD